MTKEHTQNQVAPPKRPLSGFFLYKAEKYPQVTAANPNMKVSEITQVISKQWQAESNEKKASYQASYNIAKTAFDQKMKEYIAIHGKPARKLKKVRKSKEIKIEKKAKKAKKERKVRKVKGGSSHEKRNGTVERKESK